MSSASSVRPRIYLAGPDVFFPNNERIFAALKAQCEHLGMVGMEPSDGGLDADFAGTDAERAQRIYEGNVRLIREADGVLANLVCFRGQEPDSGTVFEVGFAIALGKPVVAYGVEAGTYAERVSAAIPCARDGEGRVREVASGATVEGLGQRLNLMLGCSVAIEASMPEAAERLAAMLR